MPPRGYSDQGAWPGLVWAGLQHLQQTCLSHCDSSLLIQAVLRARQELKFLCMYVCLSGCLCVPVCVCVCVCLLTAPVI